MNSTISQSAIVYFGTTSCQRLLRQCNDLVVITCGVLQCEDGNNVKSVVGFPIQLAIGGLSGNNRCAR